MKYTYGYVRFLTRLPELIRQLDILETYNCSEILIEKINESKTNPHQLNRLKELVRERNTIVIESWSHFGRSMKDLIALVDYFSDKKVNVISHKKKIDTSTPQGKIILTVFQLFAEFKRDLIVDKTKDGLKSSRVRGRVGG